MCTRTAAVVLILCLLASTAVGAPGDRSLRLISNPGAGPFDAVTFRGATDGSRAWFATREPNEALGDTDDRLDVYERRADGALRLVTTPGSGAFDEFFLRASGDGSRVWFHTAEPHPDLGDTDTNLDVYERGQDGSFRLVSGVGNGPYDAFLSAALQDGSRVWITTREPSPVLNDTDANLDVYERRAEGGFRLVTTPGSGAFDAILAGVSRDGFRAWFQTVEPNSALGDLDAQQDFYERDASGGLRLVSTPGDGAFGAFFAGASDDGSRVWFHTAEPNAAFGDTDTTEDVYERRPDGTLRLISIPGGGVAFGTFNGSSADGSRVWFTTNAPQPALGDTDANYDLYERLANGDLRLLSDGNGPFDVTFARGAADGSRVWFTTDEPNAGVNDLDARSDIYERRADGTLRLVGPAGAGPFDVYFAGATGDGSRVWFSTNEQVAGFGDTDGAHDIYERAEDGALRLVTPAGSGAYDAAFDGASEDGSRVWYETKELNVALGDSDTARDVYESRWGVPGILTEPAVAGRGQVGQTLTCIPGTWAGDAFTLSTQWLRDGAALAGATSGPYPVGRGDAGHLLTCRATARNTIGEATATARATRVAPHLAGRIRIGGASIRGTRLTCDTAGIQGATSITYRWLRNGRATPVTTRSYRIGRIDLGQRLRCTSSGRNDGGSVAGTSAVRIIARRCMVPRLRGVLVAPARERAGLAGCRSRVLRVRGSGVRRGAVLRTTPAAPTRHPNGTTITLVVRR